MEAYQYPKQQKKSKPRIKVIKAMSDKRLAIERDKKKAYEQVTKDFCEGCGAMHGLTRSHTIGRNQRPDLIAEPKNITTLCFDCHESLERNHFWLLGNGREVIQSMLELDYQIGVNRIFRMFDRIYEQNIDIKHLDDWVEELKSQFEIQ